MLRSIPPAGNRISLKSLLFGIIKGEPGSDLSFMESNGRTIMATSSGTAAISTALLTLRKLSPRRRVIIPAYTCPQVAAAVVKAGLTPKLCDIQRNTFQMDLGQLSSQLTNDTLAVIGVHLFGIPEDIREIRRLTKDKDIFLIEDAAQCFPRWLFDHTILPTPRLIRPEGDSFSDLIIFSFGRGKPLSLLAGGALKVNNPRLTESVQSMYDSLPEPNSLFDRSYYVRVLLYSVFFRPRFYWIPEKMPWLRLGETIFTLNFRIEKMPSAVKTLGNALASKYNEIIKKRRELTEAYVERVGKFREEFSFFPDSAGNDLILQRFPMIFRKDETRDQVLLELRKRGLGATGMYPTPLNQQKGASSYLGSQGTFGNARFVSERILTLPLHEYVTQKDVEKMERIFLERL